MVYKIDQTGVDLVAVWVGYTGDQLQPPPHPLFFLLPGGLDALIHKPPDCITYVKSMECLLSFLGFLLSSEVSSVRRWQGGAVRHVKGPAHRQSPAYVVHMRVD